MKREDFDSDEEIWQPIKGYEQLYEISTHGRIKVLQRLVVYKNGVNRIFPQKIMKVHNDGNGYLTVRLTKLVRGKTWKVHILSAITFKGFIQGSINERGEKLIIDHNDNNRQNNYNSNLKVTTQRNNTSKDKKGFTSKYTGVFWSKKTSRWVSKIWIIDKRVYLGSFKCELQASEAYQNKLKSL